VIIGRESAANPLYRGCIAILLLVCSFFSACSNPTRVDDPSREAGRKFSSLADSFIQSSTALTDDLNKALITGEFASIAGSATSRIITLSDTLSEMEKLLPLMHQNLVEIASEITDAGKIWIGAAQDALDAGLASDAPRFAQARAVLDRERQRFNLGVRKWNVTIEAA